ncbi:LysR family transcriptional regulator [Bordetella sp. BOR01]|uniref:LysR family transcriptional regulator n=1 Tax=Bordetella sp. BOR01 TaxID=2854779 RepID=UPI001C47B0EC|nr:LysR family transcriptional regulator [Bordetella sp. BOR01]MBV7482193.1 LysR family transcriptional regulator [Bordetella sp. BOR01]
MPRDRYNDLQAFIAVARERSFTRAAARLGVSQSALSHTIRELEARMGVRLLTRTTRSVSPTEAGEHLMLSIAPRFQEIEAELAAVGELSDKPAGTVRITATENAAETVLWPRLAVLLPKYPQIKVELTVDARFADIVTDRYDMGVRLGDEVARDMTAVRIGPDLCFAIVGSPAYLAQHPVPKKPQDLACLDCINLRLMSHGELYAWELRKGNQQINVRVEGQLVFNGTRPILQAAIAGFGLGYLPLDMVQPHIAEGRLERVLEGWSPTFTGYHLYYASRKQLPRAMAVLIEGLRYPYSAI